MSDQPDPNDYLKYLKVGIICIGAAVALIAIGLIIQVIETAHP